MNPWSLWVSMLSRREQGQTLALYRILMGLALLYSVLTVASAGLVEPLWVSSELGDGYRKLTTTKAWLIWALGGPSPTVIWSLVAAATVSGVLVVIGLGTRLAALVALQSTLAITTINGHTGGSYDDLLANCLWLLVLADSGATWSVWARLRTGKWAPQTLVSAWPRWLIVFQLVVMYTSTGTQKVSAYWVPGGDWSALYYILQQPSWHRMDMSFLAWVFPLTQAATGATWFFEVGAPLLLLAFWYRQTRTRGGRLRGLMNRLDYRTLFAIAGVGMHIGILLLMEVGPFSYICLAMYPALFHPYEVQRALSWLHRRIRPPH